MFLEYLKFLAYFSYCLKTFLAKLCLTLSDMGFFSTVSYGRGGGGGHEDPHHNFVIAPMIMQFGTDIKLDVFYTVETKKFVTSLLLRDYDVITCILADA